MMDKFTILTLPNCHNFVYGAKRFMGSGMSTMDSIMALKDHSSSSFVHGSRSLGNPKTKFLYTKF